MTLTFIIIQYVIDVSFNLSTSAGRALNIKCIDRDLYYYTICNRYILQPLYFSRQSLKYKNVLTFTFIIIQYVIDIYFNLSTSAGRAWNIKCIDLHLYYYTICNRCILQPFYFSRQSLKYKMYWPWPLLLYNM